MVCDRPSRPPWTNRYKQNWDDAHQRIMGWWEGTSLDRPVVLTPARRDRAPLPPPKHDPLDPARRDLDEAYQIELHERTMQSMVWTAEAAPGAGTGYGSTLCMLAAMAGASIRYTADTGTAWIEPISDLYERPMPEFRPDCVPYAHTLRMIDRFQGVFGYDCVLAANPMLDPLTTLSMMRGAEQLCMDVIERPDDVRRWTERLGDLFLQIVGGYRQQRARHGRREDKNWTGLWAPGDMDALQCDFSTMLSSEMFRRFALGELEREAQFMDFACWHLDGTDEIRHVADICSVAGVRAIQWTENRGQSPLTRLDLFREIRKLGRSLLINCRNADEAVALTQTLGKDGLALTIGGLKDEKAMETVLRRLRET